VICDSLKWELLSNDVDLPYRLGVMSCVALVLLLLQTVLRVLPYMQACV